MSKTFSIGNLWGLRLTSRFNVLVVFPLTWLVLSLAGWLWLGLSAWEALLGGLLGTLLHYLSELWHHLGHAQAARRTGYPMSGVTFGGLLAVSRYPKDEGVLPASLHRRRAIGGPIASLLLTLVMGGLAWLLRPLGGWTWYLALFLFLDNLLVFTFGSLLPLPFTDGGTLRRYRSQP